jgi:hypothetical protein
VLMDSLAAALPDETGFVTGTTLKNQFLQIWGDRYRSVTGYDPPFVPPAGQDIQLFRRQKAAVGWSSLPPVVFSLMTPAAAGTVLTVRQSDGASILNLDTGSLAPTRLPPGIYKAALQGTARAALFEVNGSGETRVVL